MKACAALLVVLVAAACARRDITTAPAVIGPPPTRAEIWAAIQEPAARYHFEPSFIYALVAAESNFDPRAVNGPARGLFQLKPRAWRTVSQRPFAEAWDWRVNLAAGIDYLAWTRSTLHRHRAFSYPLLLAAFHHGLDYVEERGFDARRATVPDNAIYRELARGNLAPVPPPLGNAVHRGCAHTWSSATVGR